MPIYEFQCTACHELFEEFAKVGTRTAKCLKCGAKGKKIISNVGIAFKGGGFHVNDYTARPVSDNGSAAKSEGTGKSASEKPASEKPSTKSEGSGSTSD